MHTHTNYICHFGKKKKSKHWPLGLVMVVYDLNLQRQRLVDLCELKVSLVCMATSWTAGVT